MSGIVGIYNFDGAPVDPRLLQRMTDFMAYRGPDAQTIWVDGPVGFGHTMLRTTLETEHERQPFSVDGKNWITADARIDGREELVSKLRAKEFAPTDGATDVELILRAYQIWGEDCVHHLLGDFAFAIWDASRQRLFCARDHFGVKLFYYARVGNTFIFSNTLNCLRLHTEVSNRLNDLAVGDFLLFGCNQDKATTTFADIQRIPPGNELTCSPERVLVERYWELAVKEQIRYKQEGDYIQHFKVLLDEAVRDRLRTHAVGIYMSGGLDSTTLAAAAKRVLSQEGMPFDLRAYTVVFNSLIPDDERFYSGLAAQSLNIPIQYLEADDYPIFGYWQRPEWVRPEPQEEPFLALDMELGKLIATRSRVALYGEDADAALLPSTLTRMLNTMPFSHIVVDVLRCLLLHRKFPAVGSGILYQLRRFIGERHSESGYPRWISGELENRIGLRERWEWISSMRSKPDDGVRPKSRQRLLSPLWQSLFETLDSGVSSVPVEVRFPFLDLPLLDYLLRLPPLPWCVGKELLRISMRGLLPEAIWSRPKTPLGGYPYCEHLKRPESLWFNNLEVGIATKDYVNFDAMPRISGRISDADEVWMNFRPFILNHWLEELDDISKVAHQKELCFETRR